MIWFICLQNTTPQFFLKQDIFSKNITLWCFNIKSSLIVNILLFSSQCCQTPVVKRQSNLYTLTSINIFQIHFHHNTDFKENAFIFSAQSNILRRMCAFLLGHLHKYVTSFNRMCTFLYVYHSC